MAWNDFGASDVVGGALGAFGEKIEAFSVSMLASSVEMADRAASAARRADLMRASWQELDGLTAATYSAILDVNTAAGVCGSERVCA